MKVVQRGVQRLAVGIILGGPIMAGAQTFFGLGDLPGGFHRSEAFAVSGDGTTVVGKSSSAASGNLEYEAFRWRAGEGIVGLGVLDPGQPTSLAAAVSQDGQVVVGAVKTPQHMLPFRWTQAGGMVVLPLFGVDTYGQAWAVSGDGQTVVGGADVAWNRHEAWMWTEQTGTVSLTPGMSGFASAITPNGRVVVGGGRYWTEATGWVWLGPVPFNGTAFAQAINTDGSVIVGGYIRPGPGDSRAFRWTAENGIVNLGSLDIDESAVATAVSGDGRIIVGTSGARAFIWDAQHGMRDLRNVLIRDYGLDLSQWGLDTATGISADGRVIVGKGAGPRGPEAYMAVIPEPGTIGGLIGGLGMLALAVGRRR